MRCRSKAVRTVVGSFLILVSLGSLYSWGNMTTYVTSYMRVYLDPSITQLDTVWVLSGGVLAMPLFVSFTERIVHFVGLKKTLLLACFLMRYFIYYYPFNRLRF